MNKDNFIEYANNNFNGKAFEKVLGQIEYFYDCLNNYVLPKHSYKLGDRVLLKKGQLLHGTFRNMEALYNISKNGLIASWFFNGRISKYPSSVSVWNLKKDYLLKDYINFYSGGTVKYFNQHDDKSETEVIEFDKMNYFMQNVLEKDYLVWNMEQTKEARFLPSLVQNLVQIGIIFNVDNEYGKKLLLGDILNPSCVDDECAKSYVNGSYYERFIVDRLNKDDFFTDRESAILFGLPFNLIEGVLVGREYEKDENKLLEIKKILPNVYICNLDGEVIAI